MASYNKIMLIGNLTRDPQLTYTPSQTPVVDFGLATNRKWNGPDGTQREETCFVDCRAFGKQAETLNKYTAKGNPIFVEGRLTFDSWTGQDGVKRSKHRVTVENFQFLRGQAAPNAAPAGGYSQAPAPAPHAPVPAPGPAPMAPNPGPGASIPEDEIPF